MTKGQLEAKISEIVSKFEVVISGRGPKTIRAYIISDMIVIRMINYLSQAEKHIASTDRGIEILKNMSTLLFEESRNTLETMIQEAFNINIVSTHMDTSTRTGEKVIILTLKEDLEDKIKNNIPISVYR